MYLAKEGTKECCTCDHWKGARIREGDGLIYSLENLEGACVVSLRDPHTPDFSQGYRAPSHGDCIAWKKWLELRS